jgi:tripartite-type tricarboxylate transporter receptor subunit TctC
MKLVRFALALAFACSILSGSHALAQGEAEFYKGKSVSLLIGFGPGGANDVWARLLARHMPRHMPGEPGMTPQNMPGAGTLKLANHLATAAPRDGTVFGLINRGIPLEPLLGGQNVLLDPQKMGWIGSPDKDTSVCAVRKDAKVKTMQDLRTTELAVGATGSGADTAIYPEFLTEFLGMKFKTIKGYPGSNEIVMAMERNEVQGICVAFQSLARTRLYTDSELTILFQAGLEKDPGVPPQVPLATELTAGSKEDTDALRLFLARTALGRPFVAPPGLAPVRLATLRRAFDATMKDAAFVAEAERLKLTVEPIAGDAIARILGEIYATPPEVVRRVSRILGHVSGPAAP